MRENDIVIQCHMQRRIASASHPAQGYVQGWVGVGHRGCLRYLYTQTTTEQENEAVNHITINLLPPSTIAPSTPIYTNLSPINTDRLRLHNFDIEATDL